MEKKEQTAKDFFYEDINVFNFDNDMLNAAIKADSDLKAKACLNYLMQDFKKHNENLSDAEIKKYVLSKIAYFAGYFDDKVRKKVEKLYKCEHPIFGKFIEMGAPTAEEAYICGSRNITLKELRNENNF